MVNFIYKSHVLLALKNASDRLELSISVYHKLCSNEEKNVDIYDAVKVFLTLNPKKPKLPSS